MSDDLRRETPPDRNLGITRVIMLCDSTFNRTVALISSLTPPPTAGEMVLTTMFGHEPR